MSFSASLLERVSSLERLALSLVDAIREIKEELKPEEVTGKGGEIQILMEKKTSFSPRESENGSGR